MVFDAQCPYCEEMITITLTSIGWIISASNMSCDACMRFTFRITNFIDQNSDDDVMSFLRAITIESQAKSN
jgi:hypothetical protein